jgi:hypothetical protein
MREPGEVGVVGLLASAYSLRIPISEGVGRAFRRMSVYRSTETDGAFAVFGWARVDRVR